MPEGSSGSRTRAKRCSSASGSQDRKRGQARVQLGDARCKLDPAHAGHHDVREDDVDLPVLKAGERVGGGGGAQYLAAKVGKQVIREGANLVIIFNQQNPSPLGQRRGAGFLARTGQRLVGPGKQDRHRRARAFS